MLNEVRENNRPQTPLHRRYDPETGRIVIVKDYSQQNWSPDDEKDFHIRTLHDEKLIDGVPRRDDNFQQEMFDISNADDLPDSDRILDCRAKGLDSNICYGRD